MANFKKDLNELYKIIWYCVFVVNFEERFKMNSKITQQPKMVWWRFYYCGHESHLFQDAVYTSS